jgi:polyribonucleotide nucleotidyltransferase
MLQYNFPGYSVGEIDPMRGPGRREVGHGRLAYKAVRRILPSKEQFPYTIRIVSEITESNGSSSMATVCGTSLSLMATGVPMAKPVAGVAMGLIKEGEKFMVLTDIMGDEDHLGDMDFKVAGTKDGITALQMDIKIEGIPQDVMKAALHQAKQGRMHILGEMSKAIEVASSLNENAPKIVEMTINPQKIADVIGKSGVNIKAISEQSGCKIDIADSGLVKIYATTKEGGQIAHDMITDIITDIEVGQVYEGEVERIMQFGVIVALAGKKSGMVHISEIHTERVEDISQYLQEGQKVKVRALGFDEKRRLKLSIKKAADDYKPDEDTGSSFGEDRRSGGGRYERGGRSDDRRSNNGSGRREGGSGYQGNNRRGNDDNRRSSNNGGKRYDRDEGSSSDSSFGNFAQSLGGGEQEDDSKGFISGFFSRRKK